MPITATYYVRCDTCWGFLDGEYDSEEAALAARRENGWLAVGGATAYPEHNPDAEPTT
ncbi:hypothetical protein [Streptomyces sp. NPDC057580]|uniref:hypothetical protein n=1 Tax=Streptomyces sp. NPDC057580 TaxID=3346173 RepID=UPI0036CF3BE5